jgi:hypothetical protein
MGLASFTEAAERCSAGPGSFDFAQDKLRPVPVRTKKNL